MNGFSFQTRARTIDHLGRGQIADSPTAISELWKNAYDAYARNVSLHIFGGDRTIACIFDDGKGMTADDLRSKWLVLGTESKTEDDPEDELFRQNAGLRKRVKQGEKGIGRLSVAFLAPATVLVTKKIDGRFAVVLVDWRLFENPYLSLSDITLPVEDFDRADDVLPGIGNMIRVVLDNLGVPDPSADVDPVQAARSKVLAAAWDRFSAQETASRSPITRDAIIATWKANPIDDRVLREWSVSLGLSDHGTALIMIDVQQDLTVWVRPNIDERADELVKERLQKTLTGFTDPFILPDPPGESRLQFDYEVLVQQDATPRRILSTNDIFGPDSFRSLEHHVEGSFDEFGVFEGEIVAFGRSFGRQQITPQQSLSKSDRQQIGPFDFAVGTSEQDPKNSTHDDTMLAVIKDAASNFAGIALYRDGLRVMPYGRPDADFFGLEERRSMNAGRAYWSHRRTFGRIAFTRRDNPKLRDKAGREGLVDNRAKALLRMLVINLLTETARRYFGSDADLRREELPRLQAQYEAGQKAARRLAKRRRINVGNFIEKQRKPLQEAIAKVGEASMQARTALTSKDRERVMLAANDYRESLVLKESLRPPPMPSNAPLVEEGYRIYRDDYRELLAGIEELGKLTIQAEASVGSASPEEAVRSVFHRNQSLLAAKVDGYLRALSRHMSEIQEQWDRQASDDRKRYWTTAKGLLEEEHSADGLAAALNSLDAARSNLEDEFSDLYEPILRSLQLLQDGLDLEGAAGSLSDDMSQLEEKVRDLHAVAQVGISVEIIGHELEALDAEVRRNLSRLPSEVKGTPPYRLAYDAHSALTEKLRFLAPLKIAGYRSRETIRGSEIADYVAEFFERSLNANRIRFEATEAFRSIAVSDLRSRIYPVFVNLVNNAIFWVTRREDRQITLAFTDGKVVVSDTGPGVDPDDVDRLFTLFHTRRMGGRGVGLYLSRVNLGVAGHQIRYAVSSDPVVHDGANFIIIFRGVTTDE